MLARGASGLPVIDIEGALVGMVTKGDLMTREEIGPVLLHIPEPPLKDEEPRKKFIKGHSWRVGDVMTKSGRGLSAMCVTTIGEIFLLHHVKRVPVVQDGALLGIDSRRDLLRAATIAPPRRARMRDEEMEIAVKARLRADLGYGPNEASVIVHDNIVHVDTRGLDDLQRRAIQMRCRKSATNNLQGTRLFTDIRQQQGPL